MCVGWRMCLGPDPPDWDSPALSVSSSSYTTPSYKGQLLYKLACLGFMLTMLTPGGHNDTLLDVVKLMQ